MRNQPKYNFLKNTKYAFDGLVSALKTETSFRIEVGILIILIGVLSNIDISNIEKLILLITYFFILIMELINSAIENTVDLVTKDIHPLAKNAKDIGAAAVMMSILIHLISWIIVLIL